MTSTTPVILRRDDPISDIWGIHPPARIRDMRECADSVGITKELLDALVLCADHDPLAAMECLQTALARLGIHPRVQVGHIYNATNGRHDYREVDGPDPRD